MQAFFLAALVFALVAVMFGLQNVVPVRVTFLTWAFEGSLAVVLFVAFMMGALVSVLVSVPSIIKARLKAKGLGRQIATLESVLKSRDRETEAVHAKTSVQSERSTTDISSGSATDISSGSDSAAMRTAS